MPQLELSFLGAFAVTIADVSITKFATDKVRALLAYLALEAGQLHSRSMLAGLLWPEISEKRARSNIRLTLYRLRQALDAANPGLSDQLLTITRQTIQLNSEVGPASDLVIDVDVIRFQSLIAATHTHTHERLAACPNCLTWLRQAAELYRGELLRGFGLADAPPFEEWLLLRREMLQQQAIIVLQSLTLAYEVQANYKQAYTYANHLLQLDAYREDTHQQLMRILALRGLPDQALAQFESCRQLLRNELGVEPSTETMALVEQIRFGKLDQIASWANRDSSLPPHSSQIATTGWPSNPPTPNNSGPDPDILPEPGSLPANAYLPYQRNDDFTGRAESLRYLAQTLLEAQSKRPLVVAVTGMGGMGKSQLVVEFAFRYAQHFSGGVFWLSFASAENVAQEVALIGGERGMKLYQKRNN